VHAGLRRIGQDLPDDFGKVVISLLLGSVLAVAQVEAAKARHTNQSPVFAKRDGLDEYLNASEER
jgi:hypothetical protein